MLLVSPWIRLQLFSLNLNTLLLSILVWYHLPRTTAQSVYATTNEGVMYVDFTGPIQHTTNATFEYVTGNGDESEMCIDIRKNKLFYAKYNYGWVDYVR